MDFLRPYFIYFFLFFLVGCSGLSYLWEQGSGQIALQWKGVENEKVLSDKKVKQVFKDKIIHINNLKKFFYAYFSKKETSIYSKTTMLEGEAVTYLVIASKKTKIDPLMHEFPIMGSFPYLGFFSKKSAMNYAREIAEDKNMSIFIRPVYAYSTLGYFEDRILSSFFYFDELELSELIFHELFHTIFFVKDEVNFNEALAEHFSRELVKIYYQKEEGKLATFLERKKSESAYAKLVSDASRRLSKLYDKEKELTSSEAETILNEFLKESFFPAVKNFCQEHNWETCPSSGVWNNARFAAFMTYEGKQDKISDIQLRHRFTLKEFLGHLERTYISYSEEKPDISFFDFLKKEK